MPKCKIKKNDVVVVRSGEDKGKSGRVLEVYPDLGRALVEGIRVAKKHKKARSQNDERGIVDMELPIAISNLASVDDVTGKPTRVKIQENENGKKQRLSVDGNPLRVEG